MSKLPLRHGPDQQPQQQQQQQEQHQQHVHLPPQNRRLTGQKRALADAIADVVGTLVSLWAFYPIEVIKTNLQAGRRRTRRRITATKTTTTRRRRTSPTASSHDHSLSGVAANDDGDDNDDDGGEYDDVDDDNVHDDNRMDDIGTGQGRLPPKSKSRYRNRHVLLVQILTLRRLFRGCPTKTLQAATSSFCYSFLYSWIVHYWRSRQRRNVQRRSQQRQLPTTSHPGDHQDDGPTIPIPPLHPTTRLLLSAVAAMANTILTLPLDVISSRHAVSAWDGDGEEDGVSGGGGFAGGGGSINGRAANTLTEDVGTVLNDHEIKMDKVWKSLTATTTTTTTTTQRTTNPNESGDSTGDSVGSGMGPVDDDDDYDDNDDESSSTAEQVFHEAFCDIYPNSTKEPSEKVLSSSSYWSSSLLMSVQRDTHAVPSVEHEKGHDADRRCTTGTEGTRGEEEPGTDSSNPSLEIIEEPSTSPSRAYQSSIFNALLDGGDWTSLWKGLTPALLLCSNPAIHYTVYDVLKSRIVSSPSSPERQWHHGGDKSTGGSMTTPTMPPQPLQSLEGRRRRRRLSMVEAFLLGVVAKFVATVSTYPLIRAKVILMVTSETSMWASLVRSYGQEGGIRGLYKGFDWQLIHTLLKSALMMMVREGITEATHQFVLATIQ